MTIGCSLSFGLFTDKLLAADEMLLRNAGGLSRLLSSLYGNGVRSVELRGRTNIRTPDNFLAAVKQCHCEGLSVTDHGAIDRSDTSPKRFFSIYHRLFDSDIQDSYNITVHALPGAQETADAVGGLCRSAEQNGFPVRITLENNRNKLPSTAGDSCAGVMNIRRLAGDFAPDICFDFGHHYFNVTHFDDEPSLIPDAEFLTNVRHTHIHSVYNDRTHYPLSVGSVALSDFISALKSVGYNGVYNLELDPPRYYKDIDPLSALLDSVAILTDACKSL